MRDRSHKAFDERGNILYDKLLSFATDRETALVVSNVMESRTQTQNATVLVKTQESITRRVDVFCKNFHLFISRRIAINFTIRELNQTILNFFSHLFFTSFLIFYNLFGILHFLLCSKKLIICSKHLFTRIFAKVRPKFCYHTLFIPPNSTVHNINYNIICLNFKHYF